jgi:cysteine desulfurase
MSIYLDCNATSPIEPAVADVVMQFTREEFGNAGSRTHDYGNRAKAAVQKARDQIAAVVAAKRDEVLFTSGATESNNLAILGLSEHGLKTNRKHIISTRIEHKAVLEPLEEMERRGFEVTLISPTSEGYIDSAAVTVALRDDTLLVSVMHVNNETGVMQPISEIARGLSEHLAYLHVDAAQGFGKDLETLRNVRIDMISASAHKIYGPKGVGALFIRRRGFDRVPLAPLMYGGGQERGLRPGTIPVPLVVGFGVAAELAVKHADDRRRKCEEFRTTALEALQDLDFSFNGDPSRMMPHVVNIALPGIDSEAVMVATKGLIAISNGSACTSHSYTPSHVLEAMGLDDDHVRGALRFSWCHMTETPDWDSVVNAIKQLQ